MTGGRKCGPHNATLFDLFVEGETTSERRDRVKAAVAVCRNCPVMEQCQRDAIADPTVRGVAGGLTDARLAKARKRGAPKLTGFVPSGSGRHAKVDPLPASECDGMRSKCRCVDCVQYRRNQDAAYARNYRARKSAQRQQQRSAA